MASVLKKISGGVRSKDGIADGQRANSCDTSGNLEQEATAESNKAIPFLKGIPCPKRRQKITKPKGGQGVSPAAGEKGFAKRKGFPYELQRKRSAREDLAKK